MTTSPLGEAAEDTYNRLAGPRTAVVDMARRMAELTIPSAFPPDGYTTGDNIPGNNQSVGSHCVNNLAGRLMFMAFPPDQPFVKFEAIDYEVQAEIDSNPDLWAKLQVALSRLEQAHRKRMATTPMRSTYTGFSKQLLIAGNCLWKQMKVSSPTYFRCDQYVVKRDRHGMPLFCILKETVVVESLDEDVRDLIYADQPDLKDKPEWEREADIYSVCMLQVAHGEFSWQFWEEYKGKVIDGTDVETDFEDCPMWPAWLVPRYGQDWGGGYCEEYRGDLYIVENHGSALNDGSSIAAWALTFVDPGSRTSVRQVRSAPNLSVLAGRASDLTVFRSEKTADLAFVANNFDTASRRLERAFLLNSSIQRSGERVTAEEIKRLGTELDQAMGGLYTELAQGPQRVIVSRFIRLNEEENPKLPRLPTGKVEVQVVTGVDALGQNTEAMALEDLGGAINKFFPQEAAAILNGPNWAQRYAAARGIKPDGLVNTPEQIAQTKAADQQQALSADLLSKAAGPAAGALVKGAASGNPPTLPPPNQ